MHGIAWAEAPGPTPIGGPIMRCSKKKKRKKKDIYFIMAHDRPPNRRRPKKMWIFVWGLQRSDAYPSTTPRQQRQNVGKKLHIFIVRSPLRGPTKPLSPRAQWQFKAGLPISWCCSTSKKTLQRHKRNGSRVRNTVEPSSEPWLLNLDPLLPPFPVSKKQKTILA